MALSSMQIQLFDSRAQRDIGIARIAMKNEPWMQRALAMLREMASQEVEATGEEMRVWLLAHGLDHPTKPHAWGALTRTAALAGILTDTGRIRQMKIKQSHARRTPIWRFCR
jgi:hypothetical protein